MCLLASNAEKSPSQPQEIHHEHLKSVLEMTGLVPLHRHRRQTFDVDGETLETCTQVLLEAQCTSGYIQRVFNESLRCGFPVQPLELVCRQNDAGKHCGILVVYLPDLEWISSICNSTNECSSECQGNITMLQASLGCCINQFVNSSLVFPQYASLFSYSLWSRCGVETPPAICPPSQLDLTTTQTRNCSLIEYAQVQYESVCTYSNVQPIINALNDPQRCAFLTQTALEGCGFYDGEPCFNRSLSTEVLDNLTTAIADCTSTTSCPSTCRNSLATLRNELDCCFNNLYNATITQLGQQQLTIANNDLWMECGLETLGRCPAQLLDGPSTTLSGTASLHTTQSGTVSLHTTQSGTASLHTTDSATGVSLHTTQSDAMSLHAMHSGMLMAILGVFSF